MKKTTVKSCILLFVCICFNTVYAQTNKKVILKNSISSGGENKLTSFSVEVNADSIQSASSSGLRFSIKLSNRSGTTVTIDNPLDLVHFTLFDASGNQANIEDPSIYLIHKASQSKDLNKPDPRIYRAFVVEQVKQDDGAFTGDLKTINALPIPSNGSIEITYNIVKILKPKAVKPYTAEQEVPISSGKYKLTVSAGLVSQVEATSKGKKPYALFVMQPIMVTYGK